MDPESFEKLDRDLMKGLKNLREKKVPDEIRKNFRRSVEERLRHTARPMGFFGAAAGWPLLMLAAGLALCWWYLRPAQIQPAGVQPKTPGVIETVAAPPAGPLLEKQPALPAITESNIVEEIEVFKELGAWTDEDEKEIGIPADRIFEELEVMAAEFSQTGPVAVTETPKA